jgi:glycosyltransferase 2 family protein
VNLKVWIGALASVILLWLAIQNVDFAHAWGYIREINLWWLIPYAGLIVGEVFIRALRWYILLSPVGRQTTRHDALHQGGLREDESTQGAALAAHRPSFANLCSATLIGLMANNILPARAGEFVRAYAGARMERIPFSTSFATVVIDRVLDGLTVSALFVPTVLLYPQLPDNVRGAGYLAAGIYVFTLGFLIALLLREQATLRLVATVLRIAPRAVSSPLMRLLETFVGGLVVLRRGKLVLVSVVISFLVWLGYAGTLYFMALAFDIHLGLAESFVVLLILTIALTLPSAPGFVGAMEWAITVGLVLFGIDPSQAFAFAIVYHVTQYVPTTLAGFVALWAARLSLAEIATVQSRAEQGADVQPRDESSIEEPHPAR